MRLTLRGEYALRALVALGESYSSEVTRIQKVAESQRIPKRFLEHILNDLKLGGFLESRRGMAGGYRLARRPEEVTLAAVLRHVEGLMEAGPGAGDAAGLARGGPEEARKAIHSVMQDVNKAVAQALEKITLADLCERVRQARAESVLAADYVI